MNQEKDLNAEHFFPISDKKLSNFSKIHLFVYILVIHIIIINFIFYFIHIIKINLMFISKENIHNSYHNKKINIKLN